MDDGTTHKRDALSDEAIRRLRAATPVSAPEPEPPAAEPESRTTWSEIDLAPVLDGDLDEAPPEFLKRTDGVPLIYRGKVSGIASEPESCKGWLVCFAAKDALAQGA